MPKKYANLFSSPKKIYEWELLDLPPFSEGTISWHMQRPTVSITIEISCLTTGWCPWIPFAQWGRGVQKTLSYKGVDFQIIEDTLVAKQKNIRGIRFRISPRVDLEQMFLSLSHASYIPSVDKSYDLLSLQLDPIFPKSQMQLSHKDKTELCSVTSITSAMNIILKQPKFEPGLFAQHVFDQNHNIYGNWSVNVAHCYHIENTLCPKVERLNGFTSLHSNLMKGSPVVVSVKGAITGCAFPYNRGHLMLVYGWDNANKHVLCIDSAFKSDAATLVSYPIDSFMVAWKKSGYTAYTFLEEM